MDQQVLIAGFHRSGTSFVTQVLHEAGLFIGDELLGVAPSNPYGHFEDVVPFELHNQVLADNGLDWQVTMPRPFSVSPERWREFESFVEGRRAQHRVWGFKDPRLCLFLGVWKHLLPDARILVVFRSYRDVVWSLRRRHSRNLLDGEGAPSLHERILRDPDFAIDMWIAHNEALLSAVRLYGDDTLVVPLEAVQQGYPLVRRMNQRFGLGLAEFDSARVFDPSVTVAENPPLPARSTEVVRRAEQTMSALWNASHL